jgi:NAD(P)-dependent dehydrogenase (short-subunit alcohol dehydrogenase family)
MKFFPIALPASNAFKDQVAVVTGGTSGLGLAAAIHLINLGAAEVIISSRNVTHGQEALESIDKGTNGKSKGKVTMLELDMTKYGSVVAFAEGVKKVRRGKGGVDAVLLNAGVIGVEPKITDEGWLVSIV